MNKILNGDALLEMKKLESGSIDIIFTDPPYSSGTRREAAKGLRKSMNRGTKDTEWFGSDSLTTNGFAFLMRSCALEWNRLLKDGGHVFCFIDWRMLPTLGAAIESADLRQNGVLVWNKTYFGMGSFFRNQHEFILHFSKGVGSTPQRRDVGNVLNHKPIRNGVHPTEKPVSLLKEVLSVVYKKGDTVLDPFCGSGSTAIAVEELGGNFIGIEREGGYVSITTDRINGVQPPLQASHN